MYALNFYTDLYADMLKTNRKTATVRLGNKKNKYETGQLVWVTVGQRFGKRKKLFTAIIDRVEIKPLSELSPRDIERENPEFRSIDDVVHLMNLIYDFQVTAEEPCTVIYFSRVDE